MSLDIHLRLLDIENRIAELEKGLHQLADTIGNAKLVKEDEVKSLSTQLIDLEKRVKRYITGHKVTHSRMTMHKPKKRVLDCYEYMERNQYGKAQ